MAWKETHKPASRERILAAAGELFTRKGFNQVGIDEVMAAAGMTRGAFYAHFESKIQLYEESIVAMAKMAAQRFKEPNASLDEVIDDYLSQGHLQAKNARCPMACLVSEVAHDDERIKQIYTRLFKGFSQQLKPNTSGINSETSTETRELKGASNSQEAQIERAILMIGGLAVARSLSDPALVENVLQVARRAAKAVNSGS